MTIAHTIVMARSGAVLFISPPVPGEALAKYPELEAIFPGATFQIERLLSAIPGGNFEAPLTLSSGCNIRLVVVEALAIQRRECDIAQVVKDALSPMERQASERDISLKFEIDEGELPQARIDPVKIAWVISALVGNSLRFVKTGSRHLPGGSITVRVAYKPQSGALEFKVEDDGPGIPPAIVDEILKQSAERPPYRGVALRLARDIVHAHGGSFLVYSVEEGMDRGTTIHFSFPVAKP